MVNFIGRSGVCLFQPSHEMHKHIKSAKICSKHARNYTEMTYRPDLWRISRVNFASPFLKTGCIFATTVQHKIFLTMRRCESCTTCMICKCVQLLQLLVVAFCIFLWIGRIKIRPIKVHENETCTSISIQIFCKFEKPKTKLHSRSK